MTINTFLSWLSLKSFFFSGIIHLVRTLRKKYPYLELFLSVFSNILIEYGEIVSPYSVRMRENTDQNKFEYGQFSRSGIQNFPRNKHLLTPDTRTYVSVSGGKKCEFLGKFCVCTKGLVYFWISSRVGWNALSLSIKAFRDSSPCSQLKNMILCLLFFLKIGDEESCMGDHSFSTYAKFSKKLLFLTPWYAHVRVRMKWQLPGKCYVRTKRLIPEKI